MYQFYAYIVVTFYVLCPAKGKQSNTENAKKVIIFRPAAAILLLPLPCISIL
jgi:hypothetical protein